MPTLPLAPFHTWGQMDMAPRALLFPGPGVRAGSLFSGTTPLARGRNLQRLEANWRTVFRNQREEAAVLCALGLVDAGLGNKTDAVHEGRRTLELLPPSRDALDGALSIQYLAAIYAAVGNKDAAFEQLAIAAKLPGYLNYGELRLNPFWDPLRDDPRFRDTRGIGCP